MKVRATSLPGKGRQDTPAHPPLRARFPVVGIGASAGGLEAVGALLENLPADTGMAFIFVQHLAPGHTSLLTELLSGKTSMPVVEAAQGLAVEPNHIYVIPPNTSLTVAQGCLALTPRNDARGLPMPVDDLFHSLAEDQGAQAIGVSLSGSGTDGALGMQAIKNGGGITFAQDDMSAQYGSMPRAAVELGCVDFVLQPPAIAAELARIGRLPPQGEHPADADEAQLGRIFQLLRGSCNLDFSHYKRGTIQRRLARRMTLKNIDGLAVYVALLEADPAEQKLLCQDFLIHVTSFFRDPESFDNLVKYVFPRIIDAHAPGGALRIWVPGCSTGEEVYSLAICCLEYMEERGVKMQVQIFGTDASEPTLQTARTGIYVENIARHVSPARLEKFFVKTGDRYQVAKAVRDLCVFARHDVTSDPPFSQLNMISCRNLLIYLDPVLQKRVIPLFHYALKPDGVLILGPAENIAGFADIFSPAGNQKIKLYTRNVLSKQSQLKYMANYAGKSAATAPHPARAPGLSPKKYTEDEQRKREANRITLSRYVPAAVLCDKNLNVLEFRGDTGLYLTQPSGPPEVNLQRLARPGLLVEIGKATQRAGIEDAPVRKPNLWVETPAGPKEITLEVIPVRRAAAEEPWFLVFFEDKAPSAPVPASSFWASFGRLVLHRVRQGSAPAPEGAVQAELLRLKQELHDTHEHIRTITEEYEVATGELQASQEELQSSNEEFQSTNEELETAKEELQSANEELITTNEEIGHRNNELNTLNGKLKHALSYAESIINTVSQPFLVLDGELRVLRANPAFYKTFRTAQEDTCGRRLFDLGDRQWDIPELHQLLLQDTPFKDCEITHTFPGIGTKTMRLNGARLAWDGQTQILLAIEDVSDYTRALDALKEKDKHKNEFLAMLAHELRNPLAPMRNALDIWNRDDAGDKEKTEARKIMDRQLQKMVQLVDDLLDMARITRGMTVLRQDAVDMAQAVAHATDSARPFLDARRHIVSQSLPQEKLFVAGDAMRLEQVVSNLLINAAKYTAPEGRISVMLAREGDDAVLRVADNGVGIMPELLPHIFDLFVQAERTLDRKQGGLGVGLTLARRLVELQGGTIEAKSAGLKQGSEFIVRLPAMPSATPGISTPMAPAQLKTVAHKRILVVDDNADAALTTQTLLELQGHEVQAASDGEAALAAVQTFRPEVVILDIGLPGMDGYEIAKRLRAMPETAHALLIALSGYGQAEDIRKSKESGFDHHLLKPAETGRIEALISA